MHHFKTIEENIILFSQYSHNVSISLIVPKRGTPKSFRNIKLPKLYSNVRAITKEKHKDMIDLFCYTPPIYDNYFKNLVTQDNLLKEAKFITLLR